MAETRWRFEVSRVKFQDALLTTDGFTGVNSTLTSNVATICIIGTKKSSPSTDVRKVPRCDCKAVETGAWCLWESCKIQSRAFNAKTWDMSHFIVLNMAMLGKGAVVQLLLRPKLEFLEKLFPSTKRSLVSLASSRCNRRWKFNYKYGQVDFGNDVVYLTLRTKYIELDFQLSRQPLHRCLAHREIKRNQKKNTCIIYLKVCWIQKSACAERGLQLRWPNHKYVA